MTTTYEVISLIFEFGTFMFIVLDYFKANTK